jgi:hypothetical protein
VAGLRDVLDRIDERPPTHASWWLEFLASILDARLVRSLTPADLARLADVGARAAAPPGGPLTRVQATFPLVDAHNARGERDAATALLVSLYDGSEPEPTRAGIVLRLAARDATTDPVVRVYIDHLRNCTSKTVPVAVGRALATVLHVDVDTPVPALRRARAIVDQLRASGVAHRDILRVLGFHELFVADRPDRAVEHFERFWAAAPDDIGGLVGLLTALLHAGDHARIVAIDTGWSTGGHRRTMCL